MFPGRPEYPVEGDAQLLFGGIASETDADRRPCLGIGQADGARLVTEVVVEDGERQLLRVDWRPRYRALPQRLTVARMINCTGTTGDYAGSPDPLITDLRQRGLIRPDRLGLGIASDAEGRLFGSQGGLVAQFYTLGPARRPELWESTAIPELREQAARLATCITSDLGHRARVD